MKEDELTQSTKQGMNDLAIAYRVYMKMHDETICNGVSHMEMCIKGLNLPITTDLEKGILIGLYMGVGLNDQIRYMKAMGELAFNI